MADPQYQGSVFAEMQDKDPELFATLGCLSYPDAMYRWIDKYPDDFPERGMTPVHCSQAEAQRIIKPKQ